MPPPLLRDHRAPLHYQLEDRLRELAAAGRLGDPIPSERELCAMFSVSRTTVRAAIGRLVAEGVLQRDQGRGTFLAEPKVLQRLVGLRSFSAGVALSGARTGARLIERGRVPAPPPVAADLRVEVGAPVIYLERLRTVDERPLMLNRSYFRGDLDALLTEDVERRSVWQLIASAHGVAVARAEETIEITSLGPAEAALLDEQPNAPSFHLHLVTFDARDVPIERVHSVYRAATRFHIELRAPEARGGGNGRREAGAILMAAALDGEGGDGPR